MANVTLDVQYPGSMILNLGSGPVMPAAVQCCPCVYTLGLLEGCLAYVPGALKGTGPLICWLELIVPGLIPSESGL